MLYHIVLMLEYWSLMFLNKLFFDLQEELVKLFGCRYISIILICISGFLGFVI